MRARSSTSKSLGTRVIWWLTLFILRVIAYPSDLLQDENVTCLPCTTEPILQSIGFLRCYRVSPALVHCLWSHLLAIFGSGLRANAIGISASSFEAAWRNNSCFVYVITATKNSHCFALPLVPWLLHAPSANELFKT